MPVPRDEVEFDVAEPEPPAVDAGPQRSHPAAGWVLTAVALVAAGIVAVPETLPRAFAPAVGSAAVAWSWNATSPLTAAEMVRVSRSLVEAQPQPSGRWECTRHDESSTQVFNRPDDTVVCDAAGEFGTITVAITVSGGKSADS